MRLLVTYYNLLVVYQNSEREHAVAEAEARKNIIIFECSIRQVLL